MNTPSSSARDVQRFCDQFLSDSLLKTVRDRRPWPKLEDIIGELYFGLGSYFSPPDYKRVPSLEFFPAIPRDPRESEATRLVQYLAVNFRGLYQRNGRETVLGPMGQLKAIQPHFEAHRCIHDCYMQLLSRKSGSINQLFLANTTLHSISIFFRGNSGSHISCDDRKAAIEIGADISGLWKQYLPRWQLATRKFLKNPKLGLAEFQHSLIDGRQEVTTQVRSHATKLLGTEFFNQWRSIPHNPPLRDAFEAVERYQQWLLSLSWLCFHCNQQHAGRYFYSVRLPSPLDAKYGAHVKIPESSISIVCKGALSEPTVKSFNSFPQSLQKNPRFDELRRIVSEVFVAFEKERHQLARKGEDGALAAYVSPSAPQSELLIADYRKVDFLLRMARLLVGQRHEGHPLHFCFVFGFSSERIDSESKGVLTEVVSELQDQWQRFERGAVECSIRRTLKIRRNSEDDIASMLDGKAKPQILAGVADGMAKWIKTGDLPLQPWNTALFFEEVENKEWPIPTSIVRVTSRGVLGDESIATEFQLRRALRNLTDASPSTVGILVGESGLILFAHGKAILIPVATGTPYDIDFSKVRLWIDHRVDSDKFKDFLLERTAQGPFAQVGQVAREYACQRVADLCEALVTLGHGALIAIGIDGKGGRLPPLNPVWVVQPDKTAPSLKDGLLFYAYMSALDGATEIVLPMGEGPVLFSVRKSVLPKRHIWMYDKNGESVLSPEFRDIIDALGLVGKGTRHHSALALSADLKDKGIVLTVSADGPVTVWQQGKKATPDDDPEYQPRFKP